MNIKEPHIIETARSIRICPPPEKRSGNRWERHRKCCNQCSEDDNAAWEGLTDHIAVFFDKKQARPEPQKGEIWQINPVKGKWIKDYYLSPPAVLITGIDKNSGFAECLVIYPDTDPAAPGDIVLDQDETDFLDVIIETWNRITVRVKDLGAKLGSVPDDYLEDIKRHSENPQYIPDWALIPISIKNDNDPRNEFRKIEKNIAAGFSIRPIDVLLEKAEFFFEGMKTLLPGTVPDSSVKTVTEAVLKFRFPETMIPAYAHSGHKNLPVDWRIMIIRDERMVDFFPSKAEIETDETINGRRIISGRSESLQDHDIFRLVACLSSQSGMLDADLADMDDDGYFSVEFDVTEINDAVAAQPLFCAIYEKAVKTENDE